MGAKGLRRNYGGWETFVSQLISNWDNEFTQFIVTEIVHQKSEEKILDYNGVLCPQIYAPKLGGATMVLFAAKSFLWAIKKVKQDNIKDPIFYILGLRIGPLVYAYRRQISQLGIRVLINPDGMEWKRAKWNALVKKYFLFSERTMYWASDLIVCDSQAIESYVKRKYPTIKAKTTFIPYGSYVKEDPIIDSSITDFFTQHKIQPQQYYLIVGRFVPENNYELIIKEFMASNTTKDLVIICNLEFNRFYENLKLATHFGQDPRIKFVGTVYDSSLLVKIRNQAFAYIHGHSAGGTNPSLLEALGTTSVSLLFDVEFNREVGRSAAVYFTDRCGSLSELIQKCDSMEPDERQQRGQLSKDIILEHYTWKSVVDRYVTVFENSANRNNTI